MFRTKAMAIAASLLISSFWGCSEKPKEVKQEENKGVLVTAAKAELRPVERSITFVGELQAEQEATIKAEVKGKIRAVYKNLGEAVADGELIARIDSEECKLACEQAANALKEAQSKYDLAVLNWERADGLFKKGLISERERDEARESLKGLDASVKERHAAFNLAEKKLRDTSIVAPFSGVIKERFVNPGDYVEEKGTIASLVAVSPLKLRASVPESAARFVKRGLSVAINVEAYPDRIFDGTVIRVSPSVDPKTRSLAIEAVFPNKDGLLKPGFFADGRVITKTADKAVFVPEESIVAFAGIKKVFVIENGAASERIVKVGERLENMVEITEGLKEGEVIATSALNKLSTGVKVEVKK